MEIDKGIMEAISSVMASARAPHYKKSEPAPVDMPSLPELIVSQVHALKERCNAIQRGEN